jgi:hypothetical protein
MGEVFQHQLRWARTYRICRPGGYPASIVTHSTLWGDPHLLATGYVVRRLRGLGRRDRGAAPAAGLIARRILGVRGLLAPAVPRPGQGPVHLSSIWVLAFLGQTVRWGAPIRRRVGRAG